MLPATSASSSVAPKDESPSKDAQAEGEQELQRPQPSHERGEKNSSEAIVNTTAAQQPAEVESCTENQNQEETTAAAAPVDGVVETTNIVTEESHDSTRIVECTQPEISEQRRAPSPPIPEEVADTHRPQTTAGDVVAVTDSEVVEDANVSHVPTSHESQTARASNLCEETPSTEGPHPTQNKVDGDTKYVRDDEDQHDYQADAAEQVTAADDEESTSTAATQHALQSPAIELAAELPQVEHADDDVAARTTTNHDDSLNHDGATTQ
eukprot:TRINITY_DN9095_c0_g1_i4.p1 TRINITY_DN9095_c0_g1~~TRINITY_DN9095_c0_g1_i4.p1  ORF type:complete len:267 (-),score=21.44 TRINITY_DN9095_c0_g1_i4:71-871(-)